MIIDWDHVEKEALAAYAQDTTVIDRNDFVAGFKHGYQLILAEERRWIATEVTAARDLYAATIMNATADAKGSYTGTDVRRWQAEAAERWNSLHPLLASLVGGISTGDTTP